MKNLGKRLMSLGLSVAVSATIFVSAGLSVFAYTETTGTVTTDNVKVRSEASTTASQVSSLKNGDSVEIVDEAADASGYTWYKIRVNKSEFGYVRSDLVNKKEGSSSASETTTTSNTTEANGAAASLPATTATTTEPKSATITENSVNVRQGAGTGFDSVGKVSKGDTVTVTGEATGEDGKTWYQVTFGSNKTGFIRSDLLTVGEAIAAEGGEGENAEGGEAQEGGEGEDAQQAEEGQESSEGSDQGTAVTSEAGDGTYSLVYSTDEEGNGIWYLYDNVGGYRVKVNELIEAAKSSDEVGTLNKTNNTYKTVLIILAVVIAALVVGLILLALKLRDSYYEDDEEEEYDRYSKPTRRRAVDDEAAEAPRAKRPAEQERQVRPEREPAERTDRAERSDRAERAERTAARPQRQPRREEQQEDRAVRTRKPQAEFDQERAAKRPQDDRAQRRQADERAARQARRNEEQEERPARRQSYRNNEEASAPRNNAKRGPRNFVNEDDFEFEFLDLDDEK